MEKSYSLTSDKPFSTNGGRIKLKYTTRNTWLVKPMLIFLGIFFSF